MHKDKDGRITGASRGVWFPKKLCILVKITPVNDKKFLPFWVLTCPIWLLDKNKVNYEEQDYTVKDEEQGEAIEEV